MDSKWGLIDLLGREVLPCQYHYLTPPHCGLMSCSLGKGEKLGYLDVTGRFAVPPTYDATFPFDPASGLGKVMVRDAARKGSYGLIDLTGKVVVEPVHHHVNYPTEGMILFSSHDGERCGFLDRAGAVAIPAKYRAARKFRCGVACVADVGDGPADGEGLPTGPEEYYFIDHSGRRALGPYPGYMSGGGGEECFGSHPFPGTAWVDDPAAHQHRLIDRAGRTLLARPNDSSGPSPFKLDVGWDEPTRKRGIKNLAGDWLVDPVYDDINASPSGLFYTVKVGEDDGLLDYRGRVISPVGARGYGIAGYGCGRIAFFEWKGGVRKWGYLAIPSGEVVIPAQFTAVGRYSEGFAPYIA